MKKPLLTDLLDFKYPIIQAPMFLVSNVHMTIAALDSGITSCIPSMNFRTEQALKEAIETIKDHTNKPFGINLIVNKSANIHYSKHLKVCLDAGVDFFITSLGKPDEVIREGHKVGAKIFCDVTTVDMAKKVEDLGCDAVIGVSSEAGGHAGKIGSLELIKTLNQQLTIPVISAGGVATHDQYMEKINHGAAGVSVGTLFIASKESQVNDAYKQACIDYGSKDIIMTTKLSGTPCTVINTPYVQKIGTQENILEKIIRSNKRFKKWAKLLISLRGMGALRKAAFSATYKTLWCAGPSIEHVHEILSTEEIVRNLVGPNL